MNATILSSKMLAILAEIVSAKETADAEMSVFEYAEETDPINKRTIQESFWNDLNATLSVLDREEIEALLKISAVRE